MYEKYSNDELIGAYNDMIDYSGELSEDMLKAISLRGGLDNFQKLVQTKKIIDKETSRIRREVYEMTNLEMEFEFVRKLQNSEILSMEQLDAVVLKTFMDRQAILKDKQVSSKTIIGSLAGVFVGSIVGGLLWYISIVLTHNIYYLFLVPIYILNYFIIYFITRQTRNNWIIFLATIFSIVGSLVFGWLIVGFS